MAFTGSVATGQAVMGMAARGPRPVGLELGGKSPLVVFSDADIESAVEWAMFGAFWTNGQVRSTTPCGVNSFSGRCVTTSHAEDQGSAVGRERGAAGRRFAAPRRVCYYTRLSRRRSWYGIHMRLYLGSWLP